MSNTKELKFEVYAKLFMDNVPLAKMVNDRTLVGRCPVCGDSKKDSRKTRLYLLRKRGDYTHIITCHNCFYKKPARIFFGEQYAEQFKEFNKAWSDRNMESIKQFIDDESTEGSDSWKVKNRTFDQKLAAFDVEIKKAKIAMTSFFENFTKPINENKEAFQYMLSRSIPRHFITHMRVLKEEYHKKESFRYFYYRDYVLIPFVDYEDCKYYYFHARKFRNLESSMSKYLACPYHPDDLYIDFYFNEMNVTTEQPVIICEGTISSMNLPNCISTNGIGKQSEEFISYIEKRFGGPNNIIYANDNELRDPTARETTQRLLKAGKRVFLWGLMAKDLPKIALLKDFNDLCIAAKRDIIPLSTIEKYTANGGIDKIRMI